MSKGWEEGPCHPRDLPCPPAHVLPGPLAPDRTEPWAPRVTRLTPPRGSAAKAQEEQVWAGLGGPEDSQAQMKRGRLALPGGRARFRCAGEVEGAPRASSNEGPTALCPPRRRAFSGPACRAHSSSGGQVLISQTVTETHDSFHFPLRKLSVPRLPSGSLPGAFWEQGRTVGIPDRPPARELLPLGWGLPRPPRC